MVSREQGASPTLRGPQPWAGADEGSSCACVTSPAAAALPKLGIRVTRPTGPSGAGCGPEPHGAMGSWDSGSQAVLGKAFAGRPLQVPGRAINPSLFGAASL